MGSYGNVMTFDVTKINKVENLWSIKYQNNVMRMPLHFHGIACHKNKTMAIEKSDWNFIANLLDSTSFSHRKKVIS